jgi:hypothetical protein
VFLNKAAWAICSTYHTVLKASPGMGIFGCNMLFDIPYIRLKNIAVNGKESSIIEELFDKTSDHKARLVNKTWLIRYPQCCYLVNNNGSEFKLNFEYLCESYGIKHKPTTDKNPQANAILERIHQVLTQMLCTAELNMGNTR